MTTGVRYSFTIKFLRSHRCRHSTDAIDLTISGLDDDVA
jgi:hypothetical protein